MARSRRPKRAPREPGAEGHIKRVVQKKLLSELVMGDYFDLHGELYQVMKTSEDMYSCYSILDDEYVYLNPARHRVIKMTGDGY